MTSLFDLLFGEGGFDKFKKLSQEDNNDKNYTEEKVEFTKGKYKHVFLYKFNEQGWLVSSSEFSEYVPTEKEANSNRLQMLETELKEALDNEDYEKAAQLKKEKDQLLIAK